MSDVAIIFSSLTNPITMSNATFPFQNFTTLPTLDIIVGVQSVLLILTSSFSLLLNFCFSLCIGSVSTLPSNVIFYLILLSVSAIVHSTYTIGHSIYNFALLTGSGIFSGNTIFCKLSQIPNILCIGATNAIISGTSFELILNSIQLVAVGQINSKTSLLWTKWVILGVWIGSIFLCLMLFYAPISANTRIYCYFMFTLDSRYSSFVTYTMAATEILSLIFYLMVEYENKRQLKSFAINRAVKQSLVMRFQLTQIVNTCRSLIACSVCQTVLYFTAMCVRIFMQSAAFKKYDPSYSICLVMLNLQLYILFALLFPLIQIRLNKTLLVKILERFPNLSILFCIRKRKIEAVSTSSHAQNLVNYRVKVDEQVKNLENFWETQANNPASSKVKGVKQKNSILKSVKKVEAK